MVTNSELFDLIKSRRSVRSFKDKPIANEDLNYILDAGRWAPTPSNVQSWVFGVVTSKGPLSILKNLSPGFPDSATTGIVVCSNRKDLASFEGDELVSLRAAESSMAVQNMLLMAWNIKIGTCTVASFSQSGVKELLNLPDFIVPTLLVAAGYPKSIPNPPQRKDIERITFREVYE